MRDTGVWQKLSRARQTVHTYFDRFARPCAHALATPEGFVLFLAAIGVWHLVWWLMGWDERWVDRLTLYLSILTQATGQLIRYAEEGNSMAMHAKQDTVIAGVDKANNALIGAEDKSPEELRQLRESCGEAEDTR